MTQRDKLVNKIRNNPNNVSFADLKTALEGLGFPLVRVTGSHHMYRVGKKIVIVPRHEAQLKAYLVRKALDALDEYFGNE